MIDKIAESFFIIAMILSLATIFSFFTNSPNFNSLFITNLILFLIPLLYSLKIFIEKIRMFIIKLLKMDRIIFKEKKRTFNISQGGFLMFIAIIWLIFGIIAAIPFYLKTNSITNSLFESFNAITTTGFSVIKDIELDLYLYRSLLQWIGGIGITSFLLSALKGISGKYLANYSGIQYDYREIFRKIFLIYLTFTVLFIIILILFGVEPLNAVLLSFVSVSNGGFSVINNDLSLEQKYIVGLAMFSLSVSIVFYLTGKEIRAVLIYLIYIVLIVIIAHITGLEINDAILLTLSTATSGGYSLTNPELKDIQIFLYSIVMIIGGMTISTAGGIKINRLIEAINSIKNYLFSKFYNSKSKIINEPLLIITLFIFIYLLTVLIHLLEGYDIKQSIFNSASVVGNCGYSIIDYSNSSELLKIYLIFIMYISRIEIIPFLVLLFKLLNR